MVMAFKLQHNQGSFQLDDEDDEDESGLISAAQRVIHDYPPSSSEEDESDNSSDGGYFEDASVSKPQSVSNSMFGKARPRSPHNKEINEATVWENNGGVEDEIKSRQDQQMVSISKANQNDQRMFDVYVSLKAIPQDRFHIQVTARQDFNALFDRIRESVQLQYRVLQGLKGLRVKEIAKI